jgi:hypothetical protein
MRRIGLEPSPLWWFELPRREGSLVKGERDQTAITRHGCLSQASARTPQRLPLSESARPGRGSRYPGRLLSIAVPLERAEGSDHLACGSRSRRAVHLRDRWSCPGSWSAPASSSPRPVVASARTTSVGSGPSYGAVAARHGDAHEEWLGREDLDTFRERRRQAHRSSSWRSSVRPGCERARSAAR